MEKSICVLCGASIEVKEGFRKKIQIKEYGDMYRLDPRICHLQDCHKLPLIRLGWLFVATHEEYQERKKKLFEVFDGGFSKAKLNYEK